MEKTSTKISDYLDSLPGDSRTEMVELDKLISKAIPDAEKVMWEGKFWGGSQQRIIGYGDYQYKGRTTSGEWFKIGLALQKNYITVTVIALMGDQSIAEKYKSELGKVKIGKSTISFAKLADVNVDKLIEVVKKGYQLMTEEYG